MSSFSYDLRIFAFDVRGTHPNLGYSVVVGYPVVLRETLKQVFSSIVCIFCAILNYVMCTCASHVFDYVIRRMRKTIAHLVWPFVLGLMNEAKGADMLGKFLLIFSIVWVIFLRLS